MKIFTSLRKAALALIAVVLILGPVAGVAVHSQSPKRGGYDVPVETFEQWRGRTCFVSAGESADIGVERSTLNLLRVTDCTDAANLRDLQARFIGQSVGTAIASATTIAPSAPITHVTGTTTIQTVTVPTNCTPGCTIRLIPDGLWSTNASGNISLATTGVVNKALALTWDGSKWNPSY